MGIVSDFKGFGELDDDINALVERYKKRETSRDVEDGLSKLMSKEFIKENTGFDNLKDYFAGAVFNIKTADDFKYVKKDLLDSYVAQTTKFKSWDEMLKCAAEEKTE